MRTCCTRCFPGDFHQVAARTEHRDAGYGEAHFRRIVVDETADFVAEIGIHVRFAKEHDARGAGAVDESAALIGFAVGEAGLGDHSRGDADAAGDEKAECEVDQVDRARKPVRRDEADGDGAGERGHHVGGQ